MEEDQQQNGRLIIYKRLYGILYISGFAAPFVCILIFKDGYRLHQIFLLAAAAGIAVSEFFALIGKSTHIAVRLIERFCPKAAAFLLVHIAAFIAAYGLLALVAFL
jgi:hypothetical protein